MPETQLNSGIEQSHILAFSNNIRAKIDKMGSKLTPYVDQGSYTGERVQLVTYVGPVEFTERKTKFSDTPNTELEHTQRWVSGVDYDLGVMIDRQDTTKMLIDPMSPYVDRILEAAGRAKDSVIMNAFFAQAKTGKHGNSTTNFPTANVVPHGGTSLTVDKLKALRELMASKHVDFKTYMPCIAVTSHEKMQLMNSVEVTSKDYNQVQPLVRGDVDSFMGFKFIDYEDRSEPLVNNGDSIPTTEVSGTTYRSCPVWVPPGMHQASWQELRVRIEERVDKSYTPQIYANFIQGAARLEEDFVYSLETVI